MQKKIVKIIISLLCVIIALTIVSRISASVSVPTVETGAVKKMKISQTVKTNAKVAPGYTIPIFVHDGLYIEEICVLEGQSLTINQRLLRVNADKTNRQLSLLKSERTQLDLQIEGVANEKIHGDNVYARGVENAQEHLQNVLNTTDNDVQVAKTELENAQAEYDAYLNETDSNEALGEEQQKLLEQKLSEKEKAYHEILIQRDTSVSEAQNSLESAQIPAAESTVAAQYEEQKKRLNEQIERYEEIVADQYTINANVEGIVSDIKMQVGEVTPATAAFIIADTKQDYKLVIQEEVDKEKYIQPGMEATIGGVGKDGKSKEVKGKVNSVKNVKTETEQYLEIVIYIASNHFDMSSSVEVTLNHYSQEYDYCVPSNALNQDGKGFFVYIVDSKETTLGNLLEARKVYVDIADKNNEFFAAVPGTLTSDMEIITEASGELSEGCRIRRR